jgi:hypothetical protein
MTKHIPNLLAMKTTYRFQAIVAFAFKQIQEVSVTVLNYTIAHVEEHVQPLTA